MWNLHWKGKTKTVYEMLLMHEFQLHISLVAFSKEIPLRNFVERHADCLMHWLSNYILINRIEIVHKIQAVIHIIHVFKEKKTNQPTNNLWVHLKEKSTNIYPRINIPNANTTYTMSLHTFVSCFSILD